MRSRGTVGADRLCIGSAAMPRAVASAPLSATCEIPALALGS